MKVIHLISGGDTGGAKTHIHYLLSGICKNIDAKLVCFMQGEFSDEAKQLSIPTIILDGNILFVLKQLKTMIKTEGYDLIHSHGARGNFMASMLRRSCKIPVITTVHSDPKLDYLGRTMAGLVYGSLNSFALKRADYLVGVSDSMKSLLISRGFRPNSIFPIYNGVDFSVVPQNNNKIQYLRELGLNCDNDSVVVGIAARLDPVKDLATLIRGFAEAAAVCPNLRLIIAGDGGEKDALKALAEERNVSEKVCFAGWISDINSFFAALDINTLSSLSETFPYSITEGARAGIPTISSRVGGVPMLVEEGKTGFLFTPEDYKTLGKKLVLLAENAELRHSMGTALRQRARKNFSVEATTEAQLKIYNEVLRRERIEKSGDRDGIIISGAYGMGNAGDDAILEAIIGEMRGTHPFIPITALSRNPKETKQRFFVDSYHTFNFFSFHRAMKKTKLYLSGGGSLIQNVTSRRSLWYYLYTITAAKKLGNSVMMYGCGIGPIVDKRDETRLKTVLNRDVDIITLREQHSLDELRRFGVTEPKMLVSSDPALTLQCAAADEIETELKKYGLSSDEKYVCFSVRRWENFQDKAPIFAKAADYVCETLGLKSVFILINSREDGQASEAVRALMKNPSTVISEPMPSALTIGVLSKMRAVVSMRLHGLIFAASRGVPLVGISYDPKVTAFLDGMGEGRYLPYEELSAQGLCELIDKALAHYDNKEARGETVRRLIELEAQNSFWAEELLNK